MSKMDNPILVEWTDSAQPIAAWMFLAKKPSLEIIECVSVGWVVGETDEVLMLHLTWVILKVGDLLKHLVLFGFQNLQ